MNNTPLSRAEDILQATIDGTPYDEPPQSRVENLLIELKEVIEEGGGGGGGTTNYNHLSNKPQVNSVTLSGNKTPSDLGLASADEVLLKNGSQPASKLTIGTRGDGTVGEGSFTIGNEVVASALSAHAEGDRTTASGVFAHAEGQQTTASGNFSHAEGCQTTASATFAHAEGVATTASEMFAHTEGTNTTASGRSSHAEGDSTRASASVAHAEGENTTASGQGSHAEGSYTVAAHLYQHVSGTYNNNKNNTLFEVGNGTGPSARSNALEVYQDGHVNIGGDLYINDTKMIFPQKASLPTASSTEEGHIYQYVGATDVTYTNGYFYKCIEDSSTTPSTYIWEAIPVQAGGSGGSENYNDLTNKPQIAGVTLSGNKSASDLGLATASALDNKVDKNGTDRLMTAAEGTKLAGIRDGADVNTIESITLNGSTVVPDANKNVALTVITNAVNDLINYYKKTETYTKTEVDSLISAISTIQFEVVSSLPTTNIKTNVIYLVPKQTAQTSNVKDEYINLDGTTAGWEKIGDTEVDLSGYVTTTALNTALADYTTTANLTTLLAGKVDVVSGKGLSTNDYDNTAKGIVDGVTSALAGKVDKVSGKGLSTNDYDATAKTKLDGLANIKSVSTGLSLDSQTGALSVDSSAVLLADGSVAAQKLTVGSRGSGTAGYGSVANGSGVVASGAMSHAEGSGATASEMFAHAEGITSTASGQGSHAEGNNTTASSSASHAEGNASTADGQYSHAEGTYTTASGMASHAEGMYTVAGYDFQHVSGMNNDNKSNTLFEVGNGANSSARSNAFEVYTDGHINVNGDIYQNGSKLNLMTIPLQKRLGSYNLLDNTWSTAVVSTVTVTKNADGTLATSGTSSAADDQEIGVATLKAGTYKLVGCPADGGSNAYRLKAVNKTSSNSVIGYDDGEGLTITLAADATVGVNLVFAASVAMTGKTFKPMITPDTGAAYADYIPYAMTNKQLTDSKAGISVTTTDPGEGTALPDNTLLVVVEE